MSCLFFFIWSLLSSLIFSSSSLGLLVLSRFLCLSLFLSVSVSVWCGVWRGLARRKNRVWRFLGPTHGREQREGREGSHRQFCLPRKAHEKVLTWPHKFTERNPWILPIRSLRIDREQLVPEFSNHSLYLMNLFIFNNLEESTDTTNNTNTETPTHPTQLPSPPPLPRTRTRKRTCTCTCICVCVCQCTCVCVCVSVCNCECKCQCLCNCECLCPLFFCCISSILNLRKCHHESSKTPQLSKSNCVGTNRPLHIDMNAPKIRIVQKNNFRDEKIRIRKFGFESAN